MSLLRRIALSMALTVSSIARGEPVQSVYPDNTYMNNKIEQYFQRHPGKKYSMDNEVFLVADGRNSVGYRALEERVWTPEALSEFLQKNQHYATDEIDGHVGTDYMESPLEFYLSGGGDCEDFANFANHMLLNNGYDTSIMLLRSVEEAHAVCYVYLGDRHAYIDNTGYYEFENVKDLRDYASNIFALKKWVVGGLICPDYSVSNGYVVSEGFQNPEILDDICELIENFPVDDNEVMEILKNTPVDDNGATDIFKNNLSDDNEVMDILKNIKF